MISHVMIGYLYDADGNRVAEGSITSWSCNPSTNGFQAVDESVLGPSGEQVSELGVQTSGSVIWEHTNVWAAGALIATYDPNGLHFYFNDPLGTRRTQSDGSGVPEQACESLPFGNGETCSPYPTEHLFTGEERDAESGNDYFHARYYGSSMGRFLSPDPSQLLYANMSSPQTFDLYSYVGDNPLSYNDPTGLWWQVSCFEYPDVWKPNSNTLVGGGQHCKFWDDGQGPNLPTQIPRQRILTLPLSKDPCANADLAAAGVDPKQQIATAQGWIAAGKVGADSATRYPNPILSFFGGMLGYDQAVHTGGPNDIKDLPGHSRRDRIDVAAGNISFGITCPYGAAFCRFAAGFAQTMSGSPNFNGTLATGFDTPADDAQIRVGQAMRAAGCHE